MPTSLKFRAVLLDIEGTTTPVSFVYDVLFPFAAARLEEACGRASASSEIAEAVELLRGEHGAEPASGVCGAEPPSGVCGAEPPFGVCVPAFGDGSPYARYLMENDRKSTGLKRLQGLIWKEGYGSGELHGLVFDDVPDALRRWKEAGLRLRIFSSGSVLAQKLLFSTTEVGDLTVLFEGYHDTGTGPKKEARAYRAIAGAYELPPREILFLSDVLAELDAAAEAGMGIGFLKRPGNKDVDAHSHPEYSDFDEVDPVLGIS